MATLYSTTRPLMPLEIFGLDSYRLQIPLVLFRLPAHTAVFWHRFSRLSGTLRKPLGNPRKPSQLQRKPGGNPPLTALAHPLRPYKAFTLHRAFRFSCAQTQTPRRLHSIGRGNTFRASQLDACAEDVMPPGTQGPLAWHQPSPLLASRHLWDSSPHGKTLHRLSRPTP